MGLVGSQAALPARRADAGVQTLESSHRTVWDTALRAVWVEKPARERPQTAKGMFAKRPQGKGQEAVFRKGLSWKKFWSFERKSLVSCCSSTMGEGKWGFVHSLQKNRSASDKYLISSSITSPNGNSMSVPKFWLTARMAKGDSAAGSPLRANLPLLLRRDALLRLCAYPQNTEINVFNTLPPLLSFLGDQTKWLLRLRDHWLLWFPSPCQSNDLALHCSQTQGADCKCWWNWST